MRMKSAKFALRLGLLLAVFALVAAPAPAEANGAAELSKVDAAINRWKTVHYRYQITTGSKVLVIDAYLKQGAPDNLQYVEISKPSDMAGTKVLVKSTTEMYIYMPAFKKIRRVGSHFNKQGFLGTSLAAKQLALTRYSQLYNARVESEDPKHIVLDLTAKTSDAPFPRLKLKVIKERSVPRTIEYYNDRGVLEKTETRKRYECKGNYCVPREMVVVDHTKNLTSTLILGKNWKVNPPGISDAMFTRRRLLR